jgi:membrane-associated phospholipid phosphatase
VYLGYHYLTDVVGGLLSGLLWLLVVVGAFRVGRRYFGDGSSRMNRSPA